VLGELPGGVASYFPVSAITDRLYAGNRLAVSIRPERQEPEGDHVYGGHFVQEVSADAIGRILAEWIPSLG
jgi:hypothetical protein